MRNRVWYRSIAGRRRPFTAHSGERLNNPHWVLKEWVEMGVTTSRQTWLLKACRGESSGLRCTCSRTSVNSDEEELREMTRKPPIRALQEADFNIRQTKEIVDRPETRMREEELLTGPDDANPRHEHPVHRIGEDSRPSHNPLPTPRRHPASRRPLYGRAKTTTTAKRPSGTAKSTASRVAVIEADVHSTGCLRSVVATSWKMRPPCKCTASPITKTPFPIVRNGL